MKKTNLISKAIKIAGLRPLADACGVSYQAVRKWEQRGHLPRTEWTGETQYSTEIQAITGQRVTSQQLLDRRP